MNIATWNLNGPKMSRPRAARLRHCILSIDVDVDVWVFTETHPDVVPGARYRMAVCSSSAPDRMGDERWVSIWVRNDLQTNSSDSVKGERTACARISFPDAADWYVYGTVLPWHGDKRFSPKIGLEAFVDALGEQKAHWIDIQKAHPEARLLVAGDFNQDLLDHGHYYGSRSRRQKILEALGRAGLECVTGGPKDPVMHQIEGHASVDHLCIPRNRRPTATKMAVWPSTSQQRRGLSDHFGVVASLID